MRSTFPTLIEGELNKKVYHGMLMFLVQIKLWICV